MKKFIRISPISAEEDTKGKNMLKNPVILEFPCKNSTIFSSECLFAALSFFLDDALYIVGHYKSPSFGTIFNNLKLGPKMSEERELSPLSLTVDNRHHAVSLTLDPANESLNISVKDTRTKQLLTQRIDAKYIEERDSLAAIGDFTAVFHHLVKNIWNITIQNGNIQFKGEHAVSISLNSVGTSWDDLSYQSTDKLKEYLQQRDLKISQLEQSTITIQTEIVAIKTQSAAEVARLQGLIQKNNEEQTAIKTDFAKKVSDLNEEVKQNKKDETAVNTAVSISISTLNKQVDENKKAQEAVNTNTTTLISNVDNKVNSNKQEQTTINTNTTNKINAYKATQDTVNTQINNKIDANKQEQATININITNRITILDNKVNANKQEQIIINTQTNNKIELNKAIQDATNTNINNNIDANKTAQNTTNIKVASDIEGLVAELSFGSLNSFDRNNSRYSLVRSTHSRAFLSRLVDTEKYLDWINVDNILNRRIKYSMRILKGVEENNTKSSSIEFGIGPSLKKYTSEERFLQFKYYCISGNVLIAEKPIGNIGISKTGDTIEIEIDYPGKKITVTKVGGNPISDSIPQSLTTQPMHMYVSLKTTGQEVELNVI